MALQDLLELADKHEKEELSEDRIRAIIPAARQYIAFWREYPDLFIDFLLKSGNPQDFHFYFYQRVFLRAAIRH